MATKKIEIQDHQGNVYHPHTSADIVFMSDGTKAQDNIETNKNNITKLQNNQGPLTNLKTTNKSNLVNAINEVFQNVSNGKSSIATAITGKGVAASSNDSFSTLASKIGQISTGKKWAKGSFTFDYANRITNTKSFSINCDFVPTMFFIKLDNIYCARTVAANALISNLFSTTINEDEEFYARFRVTNLSKTNFTITFEDNYMNFNLRDGLTWYAFE